VPQCAAVAPFGSCVGYDLLVPFSWELEATSHGQCAVALEDGAGTTNLSGNDGLPLHNLLVVLGEGGHSECCLVRGLSKLSIPL
jgi:hypothetical protein